MSERTFDDIAHKLHQMADKIGDIYGVTLGVTKLGDNDLVFCDDVGDPVKAEDGGDIKATDRDEIETGVFLQLFTGRAAYAAASLMFER
jgi:hypothetical protein